MMFYPNGSICQFEGDTVTSELVLVFPTFSDDESVLAVPVGKSRAGTSIPFLIEDRLMYICYGDLFRVQKSMIGSCIGVMDTNAMDILVESVSSALRGDVLNIAMPSAIIKRPTQRDRVSAPVVHKYQPEFHSVGAYNSQPTEDFHHGADEQNEAETLTAQETHDGACEPEFEQEPIAQVDSCAGADEAGAGADEAGAGADEVEITDDDIKAESDATTTDTTTTTGMGSTGSDGMSGVASASASVGAGMDTKPAVNTEVSDKVKYTYNDYIFIMNTSQDDIDVVLRKYDIKDRRALNRVKYNLRKRFGHVTDGSQAGATEAGSVARTGGEVVGERQRQRGV